MLLSNTLLIRKTKTKMEVMFFIFAGLILLLLLLIASFLILLVYSGLFSKVAVGAGSPPIGQVVIAYKFARGPYQEVGPLFSKVSKIAPGNKCLGIYYDNPHQVEAKRLRYIVGCVLAEGLQELNEDLVKKFEAEGFDIFQLPKVENAVHTLFPFITTLSIFIAVQKVYPKMLKYVKEHNLCAHPFLEVYEGKTIHFMAPLSRQGDFYVPEALQHFEGEEPYESYDTTQDLSQSNISVSTDYDTQTEGSVMESSLLYQELESMPRDMESSSPVASRRGKENGSDEESTSSFEDLKLESESAKNNDGQ